MFELFKMTIHNVWPMIFIFTVIIVSIRIAYLICNKKKMVLYKEITMFCFIVYILLLYYIVTFQDNNYGTNNFVPFREIFRYNFSSKLFLRNVIGNVLLFVPFGIFVSNYVKSKSFFPVFLLSCLVSCTIEFAQSMIGRTADIDDVILNTLGGVLGHFIYKFGNKIAIKIPKFMKAQLFLDILSLFIILIMVYLFFKFDFWRIVS